jgi:acetoin utilization deacetylase AcuC-like enzyme
MKVFYDDRQSVEDNPSLSPSARKPAAVLKSWQELVPVEIMPVVPVTSAELELVHDREYVENVLSCRADNGFGNRLKTIADSLLWTNGSFVSAAKYAVQHKENVVSPTSGFHHAEYRSGGGFCTFNGLMLAAVILKNSFLAEKIAIADIDMHYGNGTDDIIEKLSINYINHYTFGGHLNSQNYGLETREAFGREFTSKLPDIINKLIDGVDVLFYQAGADPHVLDPYGGALTTEQLKERDRIVFTIAKEKSVPVVWNLAGGYQQDFSKVLEIHNNTALLHVEIFSK